MASTVITRSSTDGEIAVLESYYDDKKPTGLLGYYNYYVMLNAFFRASHEQFYRQKTRVLFDGNGNQ